MSCHSTSGGLVSTSLARAVTGLEEREVQKIFHALKREAQGMASPSELDVAAWRARQYDLLSRCKRMSETRRDKMRDRLFRSRSEPIPDGATFHAWNTIEARARQEQALRSIQSAVDLDPPGSQAHLYDLGEDGRPQRVWYASYGSNLHEDRFLNYIQGGTPQGSTRVYDGCTDKTPPADNIPIRFAGARPHFALTSRVWRGGIAFIDAQKGESAQGLGRAYDISIDQFDEVVAQENGLLAKWATPVPLNEALTEGRSEIGNGSYETILHIGDYQGAPVLTFTAPFSTREALTKTGHLLRTPPGGKAPVRMPVMTNRPSPAYLRMIGSGLEETFGMDEVQQADYLRGCPGGDRWSRQEMVRILRGLDPHPPLAQLEGLPATATSNKGSGTSKGKGSDLSPAFTPPDKSKWDFRRPDDAGQPALDAGSGSPVPTPNTPKPKPPPASAKNQGRSKGKVKGKGRGKGAGQDTTQRTRTGGLSEQPPTPRVTSTRRTTPQRSTSVIVPKQVDGRMVYPGVRTYAYGEDQAAGITKWSTTLDHVIAVRDRYQRQTADLRIALAQANAAGAHEHWKYTAERNLAKAELRLRQADTAVRQVQERLTRARNQSPDRYYNPASRSVSQWLAEDERLVAQQRLHEDAYRQSRQDLQTALTENNTADVDRHSRITGRLKLQLEGLEKRLAEIHTIITNAEPTSA